ncbi:MAG: arsenate reductase ArsC [Pseudomonadota bacterium]|nr:low molecular weight phosphatase family protein [Rhodospirillaceae bacterium]MEE2720252.1 arsenate reductase ArsC [Pseudomonadota bacterium]
MTGRPSSILFVCSENALRSPMAEALTKHRFPIKIFVDSVGVRDGALDPMAIAVMDEIGVDISRHRSKRLDDLMDTSFEVIVTLSPEAQNKAIELTRVTASEVEYWPTPDPSVAEGHRDARLAAYRDLRDYLIKRIEKRFGETG